MMVSGRPVVTCQARSAEMPLAPVVVGTLSFVLSRLAGRPVARRHGRARGWRVEWVVGRCGGEARQCEARHYERDDGEENDAGRPGVLHVRRRPIPGARPAT